MHLRAMPCIQGLQTARGDSHFESQMCFLVHNFRGAHPAEHQAASAHARASCAGNVPTEPGSQLHALALAVRLVRSVLQVPAVKPAKA